ncbi:hypothetical protein [Oceanobacillus sp. CF4.6]|uniref:hypothetical protein n=1 Tax=Oceanobacillus sp. CF4.6 TaxID=3373080 RepID=UPI003EE673FF
MDYNREKYNRGKMKLVTQPIIYVEGRTNKIFYQQLKELKDKFIDNGGNCIQIKEKVESQSNSYGIVDHDYLDINHERLFPIDFYSVENISLTYIEELDDLRDSIIKYIKENKIEVVRLHKPHLKICLDKEIKRVTNYHIELTDIKHHEQYIKYISKSIISDCTFIKYKDIKKMVEQYVKFYNAKFSVKINYIIDLAGYLPSKSINVIFDDTTLDRLNKVLQPELFTHV